MAIWQFKFSLVPRTAVLREHGNVPTVLEAFTPPQNDSTDLCKSYPNYWRDMPLSPQDAEKIELILPRMESWSKEAQMFGYEDGHQIEIWEDAIDAKVDMRDFDPEYLQRVVDAAVSLDCLIVLNENGRVLPPNYSDVLNACKQSRACKFVCNPKDTIRDIGAKLRKPEE